MDRSLAPPRRALFRLPRRFVFLVALTLAMPAASGLAQPPEGEAAKPSGAPAGEPAASGLPPGVLPLEGAAADHLRSLIEKAEQARGLKALRPVPAGTLDEAALRVQMTAAMKEDLSPDQLRAMELGLKAFGLIPESMSLARYLPELLTRQVAGYYDPERKYLALVRRAERSRGGKETPHPEGIEEDDMVALHELVHALQDQHFDLQGLTGTEDPTDDESTAHSALVEGDATLSMMLGAPGFDLALLEKVGPTLEKMLDDPTFFASADLPGGEGMKDAPPFIRDSLLFSYLKGFLFAFRVRLAEGQKLLDYAFASDPPSSSEQILHPEKWFGDRDDPVDLKLPDLAAMLPRLTERSGGEMGELGVRLLLRGKAGAARGADGTARADRAAAGWGGDRFEIYARGQERRLVWLLDWDTERDADEFVAAARGLGITWKIERLAPRRVAVLRGDWPREEKKILRQRLGAVEARAPRNARIDPAAIPPALEGKVP